MCQPLHDGCVHVHRRWHRLLPRRLYRHRRHLFHRCMHVHRHCHGLLQRRQGLTLVHWSAERNRVLLDRAYIQGLFTGFSGDV